MVDKKKKPSELTAEEIAEIRDKNSTKATMGEGKPPSPLEVGKKLYNDMKSIVKESMEKTVKTREENKKNYNKTKTK